MSARSRRSAACRARAARLSRNSRSIASDRLSPVFRAARSTPFRTSSESVIDVFNFIPLLYSTSVCAEEFVLLVEMALQIGGRRRGSGPLEPVGVQRGIDQRGVNLLDFPPVPQ